MAICNRESHVLRRGARGSLNICGEFMMIYKENDNLDIEAINRYRSMTQEERDRFIKEKEDAIRKEIENDTK